MFIRLEAQGEAINGGAGQKGAQPPEGRGDDRRAPSTDRNPLICCIADATVYRRPVERCFGPLNRLCHPAKRPIPFGGTTRTRAWRKIRAFPKFSPPPP